MMKHFCSFKKDHPTIYNILFLFLHVEVSWFRLGSKFSKCFCYLILLTISHLHCNHVILNCSPKSLHRFEFCKFICIFILFVNNFISVNLISFKFFEIKSLIDFDNRIIHQWHLNFLKLKFFPLNVQWFLTFF